jgi:hypothetical protein
MPPMPERVAAIKRAIENSQDFTGLAHGGEDAVVAWAKAHGMNGRALICQWQESYRQRQRELAGTRPNKRPDLSAPRREGETGKSAEFAAGNCAAIAADLDYWPLAETAPVDDPPDDPMPVCSACRGTGKGPDGSVCKICNGAGKIPAEDQPDDGDEEDDDEKASFRYEYEEE